MTIDEVVRAAVADEVRKALEEIRSMVAESVRGAATDDGYMSVEKAAEFAEVHPDTIRGWVKAGKLPEHRAGRELRLLRSELRAFMNADVANGPRQSAEDEAGRILSRRRA